ncbi:Oxo-4-hydroxy-4-carboxy-5-ureidoimidazoline decarboxylase [Tricharina praecox]|uniref:Oxo-4-hydroxy-4-carboxy-5-ureidoimidazoline decarboxylase n=1 Tax=Tricharina praecox TaxID=43433 RepID=UPI00221F9472|nr:Oxo-4-hydroxy-4-carboxy-5-ureidoimidazoline decarboxylase [Tricharina praecox]KAI5850895.1 Oxo-4-hydroxy-4-carboxy-5-ureidoimidazoline decarboxylase [Tricharina praecox]
MLLPTLLPDPPVATPEVLSLLFEPSPALHALIASAISTSTPSLALAGRAHPALHALISTPTSISPSPAEFLTYADLIEWTTSQILSLRRDDPRLLEILASHPRLGEKKVDSEVSRKEQASLSGGDKEDEGVRLSALNKRYEETFPGLRFVVFVNSRSRDEVMADMVARIERGDIELEKVEAITAMRDIALDRAAKFTVAL